ncbi:hypothetical protein ACIRQP_11410 [Streptomyces sp. NPDC102274]
MNARVSTEEAEDLRAAHEDLALGARTEVLVRVVQGDDATTSGAAPTVT